MVMDQVHLFQALLADQVVEVMEQVVLVDQETHLRLIPLKEVMVVQVLDHKVEQVVETDSSAAKGAASRQGAGRRMKHISTDKLFVQNLVSDGTLKLQKVHKDVNVADLGTKYVEKRTLERLVKLLGAFWSQTAVKVAEAMAMKDNSNNNNNNHNDIGDSNRT